MLNNVYNNPSISYLVAPYQSNLVERWSHMAHTTTEWNEETFKAYMLLQNQIYQFATNILMSYASRRNRINCCLSTIKHHPNTNISKHHSKLEAIFKIISDETIQNVHEQSFQSHIINPMVQFYNDEMGYFAIQSIIIDLFIYYDRNNTALVHIKSGLDPINVLNGVEDGKIISDIIDRIF